MSKKEELLKPNGKDGGNNESTQLESVQVPDLTQKLKSLIFSSPNLSGTKDQLMQVTNIDKIIQEINEFIRQSFRHSIN